MSTPIDLYSPGEIIYTRDLDGQVVRVFVVTEQGHLKPVTQEDVR